MLQLRAHLEHYHLQEKTIVPEPGNSSISLLDHISVEEVYRARSRCITDISDTPLVRLHTSEDRPRIYLKLENLQPTGAFKVRPAFNAVSALVEKNQASGVYTASSGNMAQGVAWAAARLGVPASVLVPDSPALSATKLERLGRYPVEIKKLEPDEWWDVLMSFDHPPTSGAFIHPVANPDVVAGNGVIGLEIIEAVPGVDTIIAPFGGGGLSCGISLAAKSVKPNVRVHPAEIEGAAPLAAALSAGKPVSVPEGPGFTSGIGVGRAVAEMLPVARHLLDESFFVTVDEIAEAVHLLFHQNRVVVEGAGAASVAAALRHGLKGETIVCVISGGNINPPDLATLLEGNIPGSTHQRE